MTGSVTDAQGRRRSRALSKEKSFSKRNTSSETEEGPNPRRSSPSPSRPHSSESRPRSSTSQDGIVVESIKRRKKKGTEAVEGHKVNFTVTIAQAILTGCQSEAVEGGNTKDEGKKKKRVVDAPKAQTHFHLEYFLLPEDEEPVRTDVVTFGLAAKLYTDKQEPKVLKTWQDGDTTWVAWTHCHTVTFTEKMLVKLFTHTVEVRIWDTRDKLSTRARFDRPKAFKFPSTKQDEESGVRSLVLKQSSSFQSMQPKKGTLLRPLPSEVKVTIEPNHKSDAAADTDQNGGSRENEKAKQSVDMPEKLNSNLENGRHKQHEAQPVPTDMQDGEPIRSFSRLGHMVAPEEPEERGTRVPGFRDPPKASTSRSHSQPPAARNKTGLSEVTILANSHNKYTKPAENSECQGRRSRKAEAAAAAAAELVRRYGVCSIPIRMNLFFAGTQTVTERLVSPVNALGDLFVTVSVSGPLMSEETRQRLNPLVIKVQSASDMPSTPLSFADLRLLCQPAYVKYKFFQQMEHHSVGRLQDNSLYWDDVNVILAGTLKHSELIEALNGPPLEIEVHDRDRKLDKPELVPTLFGDDLQDKKISNVGTVTSKRTLHNAFKGRENTWDPYGIAKLDLSGLLLGEKVLHITTPIHNCPTQDPLGASKADGKLVGVAGAVDGPEDEPLAAAHYMQSQATLKVRVEITYPLTNPTQVAAKETNVKTNECPFGRLVFVFDYWKTELLQQLTSHILNINAEALNLNHLPQHVMESALSTYKLTREQQESRTLDVITGFHLLDGEMHMFVLEGLCEGGIKLLWQYLPQKLNQEMLVLYNSALQFHGRLYGLLDVDLCDIKLHEPLSVIVQQPLLYVRDMVPLPCFQALTKLYQLVHCEKLRYAIVSDLFPTAEMVVSMSKEFGVPLTAHDFEELRTAVEAESSMKQQHGEESHASRVWTPIDNLNFDFMQRLQSRIQDPGTRDFKTENIKAVREKSMVNKLQRSQTLPVTIKCDVTVAHNYSSQTLNSTDLAKEKLRQHLSKSGDARLHTYCPEYHHSMTVVPVDQSALAKQAKEESRAAWKTSQGWIYPGRKTMIDSNMHPLKPHPARVDQLAEFWEENALHANVLQPTLDRERHTWTDRMQDFDVWTKPPPFFGKDEPVTIHLAGEKLKQERIQALTNDFNTWKSRVTVEDTSCHFHRSLPATESRAAGRKAGNQLDRLQGILKDPPVKLALGRPGFAIKEIPPLSVVLNPSVDTLARLEGIQPSASYSEPPNYGKGFNHGPMAHVNWALEKNKIPVRDYEHQVFAKLKGHDFNVYHQERSMLHKRSIQQLSDLEYSKSHMFRWPVQSAPPAGSKPYHLPGLFDISELKHRHWQQTAVQPENSASAVESC